MNTLISSAKQAADAADFAAFWAEHGQVERSDTQKFWLWLLRVLGVEQAETFIEFEESARMDEAHGFIDAHIPSTHVLIEQKKRSRDLRAPIRQSDGTLLTPFQQARRYAATLPYSRRPRWIVTCNFAEFLVHDMENPNAEPESIRLADLENELYRLHFLVNAASDRVAREMEVSIEAGRIVGRIYDALLAQYGDPTPEVLHWLNVLCVRLVFCLYAEDAGIFADDQFHDWLATIPTHRLRQALLDLFAVLDTPKEARSRYLDPALAAFPYVNGSLFSGASEIPQFTEDLRTALLEKASLGFDWAEISPTIFGAVFESTLNPETRRSGGMHYTSIENIHKVIDPLFLDGLRAELDGILEATATGTTGTAGTKGTGTVAREAQARLRAFQDKLAGLSFLDPACGSGNFLTETYLSLRKLENEAIAALIGPQSLLDLEGNPVAVKVKISQFHGIEINDFAVSVAKTALWIAESQMLAQTAKLLHRNLDFLPLKTAADIREGNALRMDWEEGLNSRGDAEARRHFDYIIGNPPFVGASMMTAEQKAEAVAIFGPGKRVNSIDYVGAWYHKAAALMQGTKTRAALVATNSITQGEQVAPLWRPLVEKYGVSIDFAHRTFRWDSESSEKAHVHCVIVGFSCQSPRPGGAGDPPANLSENAASGGAGDPPAEKATRTPFAGGPPAPPGEKPYPEGWHTRHYLPHAEYRRLQFVTYRLFDSLPAEVVLRWKNELRITEATAPDSPEAAELRRRIDRFEDAGHGSCFLRDPRIAALVRDNLLHFDGERYRLLDWCIMPNHVHVLVEVAEGQTLSGLLHSWRSWTAHEANKLLGRTGPFWQSEYFDRFIRDAEHLRKTIAYIDENPSKAGLRDWPWTAKPGGAVPGGAVPGGAGGPPATRIAGGPPAPPGGKPLFDGPRHILVPHINPYLVAAPDVFVETRARPLCDVPPMTYGNKPTDGGNFILSEAERDALLAQTPALAPFIRRYVGARDFIRSDEIRYCLWLKDASPALLHANGEVMRRIAAVRDFRLASSAAPTRALAEQPWRFFSTPQTEQNYLLLPEVSSEQRRYIPIGFMDAATIAANTCLIVPAATLYHFGILTSNVHMAWMRTIAGRLKSDYRYSAAIVYNTFPWSSLRASASPREKISATARAILDARAAHPDSTLADLYDPLTMPPDLLNAHRANDRAVMSAYGFDAKMTESDCVAALFRLYEGLAGKTVS